MVVCGDDGLAYRLAAELRGVHRERVTLVVPPNERTLRPPVVGRARAASAALFDRVVSATVGRGGGTGAATTAGGATTSACGRRRAHPAGRGGPRINLQPTA
ncbi:potassium transporter TrkA, partial [Streptomyces sp. NPDC048045]